MQQHSLFVQFIDSNLFAKYAIKTQKRKFNTSKGKKLFLVYVSTKIYLLPKW